MKDLESALEEAEFQVVNQDYPSREHSIEELAEIAIPPAIENCHGEKPVHFVTHSLGGILVRQYLKQNKMEHLGRVVMLGPPNQGSEVVDELAGVPGFDLINGPAGQQLGTEDTSVPNSLGKADFDLGIIAGENSINLVLSYLIPGEDDGKVSIERAKLEGMKDFLIVPVSHPFLMRDEEVIEQVIYYLQHGFFEREISEDPNEALLPSDVLKPQDSSID